MRLRLITMSFLFAACATSDPSSGARVDPSATTGTSEDSLIGYIEPEFDDGTFAGKGWRNDFIAQETSTFEFVFTAFYSTPDGSPIDAVIGFSNGPAAHFTDLGPILRLAPDGFVDARDGWTYRAETSFPYPVGALRGRMSIDVARHRYSAWVGPFETGAQVPIAIDYAFRTEQQGVPRLDNAGRFIDSPTGRMFIGRSHITSPCEATSAGGGWSATAFPPHGGKLSVSVNATAGAHDGALDAVIGLSDGAPGHFTDLAAIVRFAPDGTFDARNGDVYTADRVLRYVPGTPYNLRFDLDLDAGTYSVVVSTPWRLDLPQTWIARDYRFRTEQQGVTQLDTLGRFVDSSCGAVEICDLTVSY